MKPLPAASAKYAALLNNPDCERIQVLENDLILEAGERYETSDHAARHSSTKYIAEYWITENNQFHPVPKNDVNVARFNIAMATLINRVRTWGKSETEKYLQIWM